MNTPESLKHTKWECKYHIVWIPKYRKKSLYKDLRQYMGGADSIECKLYVTVGTILINLIPKLLPSSF
jgi:REP element-mobilizing transposase RayT